MQWTEFESRARHMMRQHPRWFELERDPPASPEDIRLAEAALGVTLPEAYREFLRVFGGGYFGFALLFSVGDGDWSIVRNNAGSKPGFVRPPRGATSVRLRNVGAFDELGLDAEELALLAPPGTRILAATTTLAADE